MKLFQKLKKLRKLKRLKTIDSTLGLPPKDTLYVFYFFNFLSFFNSNIK